MLAAVYSGSAGISGVQQDVFVVGNIIILGNSRTKEEIILREIPFQSGDTIKSYETEELFARTENSIFNTGLFLSVSVRTDDQDADRRNILIIVRERWYTYPIPILELADRNFNEWWEQRGRDLSRVNFGINLIQRNMRGRNETLKLKLQGGFTKKLEMSYLIPYINKNRNAGLQLGISYILTRDVAFTLQDHRLVYLETEGNALRRFSAGATYTYRQGLFSTHYAGLSYNYHAVADTVVEVNPNYLGNSPQSYPALLYRFEKDHRDIAYYPLKGSYWFAGSSLSGLGFLGNPDIYELNGGVSIFRTVAKHLFLANSISAKVSVPENQPFFNIRALGYGNQVVRGYELYVINGQHYGLTKNSLKYRIINRQKDIKGFKSEQFGTIPLAVFLSLNADAGYVVDQSEIPGNNRLSNEFLLGGGPGIELATYYDIVMRLEYSMTIQGDRGFFLHFGAAISGKPRFY